MLKDTVLKVVASLFIIGLIVLVVVTLLSNYITAFKQGGVAAPNITTGMDTGYKTSGSASKATASPGVPYPPSNMTMSMEGPPPDMMMPMPGPIIVPTMQIPVMPMPQPSMQPPETTPVKKPVAPPIMPGRPVITPQVPQRGGWPQMPDMTEYQTGWQNVLAMLYEILARMFNVPYIAPSQGFY